MAILCTRCGSQNSDVSKFCLSCGNDLRTAQPAPAGFGPPPPLPNAPPGFNTLGSPPMPPPGFVPPPPQNTPAISTSPFGPSPGFAPPSPPNAPPPGFAPPSPPNAPPPGFGALGPPPPAAPPIQGFVPPSPLMQPTPISGGPSASPSLGQVPIPQGASPIFATGDLTGFAEGLRLIAVELRGISISKTLLSTHLLPSPLPNVAAVAVRYGRSMHVLCAGGNFPQPIWPSRDFSDRDKLLHATIGIKVGPEIMIPWVLTYVLPGVFPDVGRDSQSQTAFVEAADSFGVGLDPIGLESARKQGFPEIGKNHARFLIVSEPKQSVAGLEIKWGDRPFEMLYIPTPGVVSRSAPWT